MERTMEQAMRPAELLERLRRPQLPAASRDSQSLRTVIALAQGGYYLLTGLFPVVSMRWFEKVLGPKDSHWLVKTHSLMTGAIGAVLVWAGLRKSTSPEIPALGMAASAGLALPEVYYLARRRIPRNYLIDILPQMAFLALWGAALVRGGKNR